MTRNEKTKTKNLRCTGSRQEAVELVLRKVSVFVTVIVDENNTGGWSKQGVTVIRLYVSRRAVVEGRFTGLCDSLAFTRSDATRLDSTRLDCG